MVGKVQMTFFKNLPFISTSEEETSYCKLSESSVRELQAKVERYERALKGLMPFIGEDEDLFITDAYKEAIVKAREALESK